MWPACYRALFEERPDVPDLKTGKCSKKIGNRLFFIKNLVDAKRNALRVQIHFPVPDAFERRLGKQFDLQFDARP
jgi:hypothetical protein